MVCRNNIFRIDLEASVRNENQIQMTHMTISNF